MYNGWTNYQTWRVYLEFFEFMEIEDEWDAGTLQDMIDEHIREQTDNGLAQDYALAFLDAVNYQEILDHLKED